VQPNEVTTEEEDNDVKKYDTKYKQKWGSRTVDNRQGGKERRSFVNYSDAEVRKMSYLQMFLVLFPCDFLCNVIVEATNQNLLDINKLKIDVSELLVYFGIWFLLSTYGKDFSIRDCWNLSPIDSFEGPPVRLNNYMTRNRFYDITSCLAFTLPNPPIFKDRFWEVRDLLIAWNKNMIDQFIPSWISCLDESMSVWLNKWTCPGWRFVGRKPKPFGNEYHTIADGLCSIVYGLELCEGKKDRPKERPKPEFSQYGPTGGLLLRLCKVLFGKGKVVILDSGFCILQALIELAKQGVYASAVIKERKYWPTSIDGDAIDVYMLDKNVGECATLKGEIDNVPYDIFSYERCWVYDEAHVDLWNPHSTNT
jgi:hypothetical protein